MKPEIYLIIGVTGEYDDRQDWVVCYFFDKIKAEAFASAAQKAGEAKEDYDNTPTEYDPHFAKDYTGTHYHVATVRCGE